MAETTDSDRRPDLAESRRSDRRKSLPVIAKLLSTDEMAPSANGILGIRSELLGLTMLVLVLPFLVVSHAVVRRPGVRDTAKGGGARNRARCRRHK